MSLLTTSVGDVTVGDKKYDVYFVVPDGGRPVDHAMICFHGWVGNSPDMEGFGPGYLQGNLLYNWLYVFPQDREGVWRGGSWWLGEGGSGVYDQVVDELIDYVGNYCGIPRNNIAFWGSSMGGYGALYHGLRRRIPYIMVNVPQTDLFEEEYWSRAKQFLQNMFPGVDDVEEGRKRFPHGDLKNLIDENVASLIDIEAARFDMTPHYFENQVKSFADRLCDFGINFRLCVNPLQMHGIIITPGGAARRWQDWQGLYGGDMRYDHTLLAENVDNRQKQIETADLFE